MTHFATSLPVACLLLLASIPWPAQAADADKAFAIDGAGRASCERFLKARANKKPAYWMMIGWMQGYMTGLNRSTPETYDLTPWQGTPLLDAALAAYCEAHPGAKLLDGADELGRQFLAQRLRTKEARVTVRHGARSAVLYQATLDEVVAQLRQRGLLDGDVQPRAGEYPRAVREAVEAFQRLQSLKVTGLPNQATLHRLFYGDRLKTAPGTDSAGIQNERS